MSAWVDRPGRGIAKYQFNAADASQLSLNVNDQVEIRQENSGWFRGTLVGQPGPAKLFPVSYVQFIPLEEAAPAPAPVASPTPVQQHLSPAAQFQHNFQQPTTIQSQFQTPTAQYQQPATFQSQGQFGMPGAGGYSQGTLRAGGLNQLMRGGAATAAPSQFLREQQVQAAQQQQQAAAAQQQQQQQQQTISPASPSGQHAPFFQQQQQQTATQQQPQQAPTQQQQPPTYSQPAQTAQQTTQTQLSLQTANMNNAVANAVLSPSGATQTSTSPASPAIIPTYNPTATKKAAPTTTTTAGTAQTLFFPQILDDNRDGAGEDAFDGPVAPGYFSTKGRDARPYDPTTDNIVEVLDSYKLVDPLGAHDILLDFTNLDDKALKDNANSTVLQLRHAQHQSITLSTEPALREGGSSTNNVKVKRRGSSSMVQHENIASSTTVSTLFPTYDTTAQYLSGESTLPPKRYQLFLQVNVCIFSVNEYTELFFSLYSTTQGRYITEDYVVRLPPPGLPEHGAILGRMKTVFRDLTPEDLRSDLWLVCRIYRNGALLMDPKGNAVPSSSMPTKKDDKKQKDPTTRRCFGCAATFISQANLTAQIGKKYEPPPNQLAIYVPTNEIAFPQFHNVLIQKAKGLLKDNRDYEAVPRAKGIALSLTLYEGEITQVREQNRSTLKEVFDTMKLCYPLYWDIKQPRTDFYVTLQSCIALQDKKASARNIEVRIKLLTNQEYHELNNCIYLGNASAKEDAIPYFSSSVYYHSNTPQFNETFKIRATPQELQNCHLFFEMWHISTNPKKSACFSTAHFALTHPGKNGAPCFVADAEHVVPTYKPYFKEDKYLGESYRNKAQVRKGESITIQTHLFSTQITSQPTLAELRGGDWKTAGLPRLTTLLQALMFTKKTAPAANNNSSIMSGSSALMPPAPFGSVQSTNASQDEPLTYIETNQLRHNMVAILHTLLAIFSSPVHQSLHGLAFDALVHIISRLVLEAHPMLETFVSEQLNGRELIGGVWRLLGFLDGAMDHYRSYVVTQVEAANSSGEQQKEQNQQIEDNTNSPLSVTNANNGSSNSSNNNANGSGSTTPRASNSGQHDAFNPSNSIRNNRRASSVQGTLGLFQQQMAAGQIAGIPPSPSGPKTTGGSSSSSSSSSNSTYGNTGNDSSNNLNSMSSATNNSTTSQYNIGNNYSIRPNYTAPQDWSLQDAELSALQRFSLAMPYITRIVVTLFTYYEQQPTSAQQQMQQLQNTQQAQQASRGFRHQSVITSQNDLNQFRQESSQQPSNGSTPYVHPGEFLTRDQFKSYIEGLFTSLHTILQQQITSDKSSKAIPISQVILLRSYPELIIPLTYNNTISTLSCLFTCEEAKNLIQGMLRSTFNHPTLGTQQLNVIKHFITGIVGTTHSAYDAMTQTILPNPSDPKNPHPVAALGWNRHVVSYLRTWLLTPKLYKQCTLHTGILKQLLPQFLTQLQTTISNSMSHGSLTEAILAVPILEHIYSLIFAANKHNDSNIQQITYIQDIKDYYFTGQRIIPDPSAALNTITETNAKLYDLTITQPEDIFPIATLVDLLPSLITILSNYIAMYPKMKFPKSDISFPELTLPDWKVINSTFVDILPQVMMMIFSIFHLVSKDDITYYFTKKMSIEQCSLLITRLLFICNGLTQYSIVPLEWINLELFQKQSIVNIVKLTAPIITSLFNDDKTFNPFLWVYWLQLALDCKAPNYFDSRQSSLRETYIKQRVNRLQHEKEVGLLFEKMWDSLSSEHKAATIPVLVEKLINIISSRECDENAKALALTIYHQLLQAEYEATQSFSVVERYTIDSLYEVANQSSDRADSAMNKMYVSTWQSFEEIGKTDPHLQQTLTKDGQEFLEHLKNLFSLMSSLFTHPTEPEWEYDRTSVVLRLIRYIENSQSRDLEQAKKLQKATKAAAKQKKKLLLQQQQITPEDSDNEDENDDNEQDQALNNAVQTRKAMHTRYIQYLVDLHVSHNNFSEAGMSYIQQAKMLDWSPMMLDASGPDFPAETESERKVRLLDHAIKALSKASDYERCVQLIDYLRYYYQFLTYDYKSLARHIAQQAQFFSQMMSSSRVYSTYYRVVLYGQCAKEAIQNAGNQVANPLHNPEDGLEFVYKGNTLEGVGVFIDRLKKRYTNAHFHMSSEKPNAQLMAQHSSIVGIVALNVPAPEISLDVLAACPEAKKQFEEAMQENDPNMITWDWSTNNRSTTSFIQKQHSITTHPRDAQGIAGFYPEPTSVTQYRTNNRVYVFEYSRPWRRGEDKRPQNEFIDLWLIRTFLIIEEPFPTSRRRVEVIARIERTQKPIENAIEQVNNKTKELARLIQEVAAISPHEHADTRKLSMIVQGMVDPGVNGGNAKYIEAFLTSNFATHESVVLPEEKEDIEQTLNERRRCQQELKQALKEQLVLLKEGVAVWARRADSSQHGLIQHLKSTYASTVQKLAPILD